MAIESEIGDDIAEVFQELGSKVRIYKYGTGESTDEYIDTNYEVNHVYPWTSQNVLIGSFKYTTVAVPGDLVTFIDDSDNLTQCLLVALVPERFEQAVISKEGIIYVCNTLAQVLRRSVAEERDDNYDLQVTWPNVYSGEYALWSGSMQAEEYQQEVFGDFALMRDKVYISDNLDVQIGDRLALKDSLEQSGEYREVYNIENKRFSGIKICAVREDTRE